MIVNKGLGNRTLVIKYRLDMALKYIGLSGGRKLTCSVSFHWQLKSNEKDTSELTTELTFSCFYLQPLSF